MTRASKITLIFFGAVSFLPAPAPAQEVRRAIPADPDRQVVPPPLKPFLDEKPAPTPQPLATPKPRAKSKPTPAPLPAEAEPIEVRPRPGAAGTPEQMQIDYANGLYARKMYDMAVPEYEKYLRIYLSGTEREAAYFRLAECQRLLGNTNAAREAYSALLATFGAGEFLGPAAYRLADIFFDEKKYREAYPLYRKASVRLKDPAVVNSAKFNMARCLENLGERAEARAVYEDLIAAKENNPFREPSRFALAQLLADAGRKAEALKQYQALETEASSDEAKAEALVKAGLLEIDLEQSQKATADLSRALKLPQIGKWKDVAQLGLLRLLYQNEKYNQLIESFRTGGKDLSDEARPEATVLAANAYRQTGEHEKARELYDKVMHDYPGSVYAKEAQYERLVSLYAANDPNVAKAADDYLAQNADGEKREPVQLLKAEALFKQKKYASAAPIYAALQKSRLGFALKADALFKLGWCYSETQQLDEAIKTYTQFLNENSHHKLAPTALAQRAIAFQQQKKFTEALKDFDAIITRYRDAKERELALQQKALILGQQQDNRGMSAAFEQLLRDYPKSAAAAQAHYWIGWAAFEAKDYQNAIAPLDAARKADKEEYFERASLRILLAQYNLEHRDDLAAEIDFYTKSGGKEKPPAQVLRWLGSRFLNDKLFEPSEKYLSMLVAREADSSADDWLNLGRAQLGLRKFADAAKSLRTYLEAVSEPFPKTIGLLALGEAQLGLRQFDDAQKSADEACKLQPEGPLNAQGRMLSGDIEMARGDLDKATKIYRSIAVIIDDPALTPQALEKAHDALKKLGDDKNAAKVLNELQSKYPEYPLHAAAKP